MSQKYWYWGYRFFEFRVDWPFSPIEWTPSWICSIARVVHVTQLPCSASLTVCSQLSYQFSAPSSGFLPWHVQATGTEDNFCPFSCLEVACHSVTTPAAHSCLSLSKYNRLQLSKLQQEKKRESGREWSPPTLQLLGKTCQGNAANPF